MRPLFSLSAGVAAFSLIAMLAACGGGGGDDKKEPELPVGTLKFSNSASAGTYVVDAGTATARIETTTTPDDSVVVVMDGNPEFRLAFIYDSATGQVLGSGMDVSATGQQFSCADAVRNPDPGVVPCTASALVLDKTGRTLKMTNFVVPGDPVGSPSVTINGTVAWPAPTP